MQRCYELGSHRLSHAAKGIEKRKHGRSGPIVADAGSIACASAFFNQSPHLRSPPRRPPLPAAEFLLDAFARSCGEWKRCGRRCAHRRPGRCQSQKRGMFGARAACREVVGVRDWGMFRARGSTMHKLLIFLVYCN
jgi:hypothetical protein